MKIIGTRSRVFKTLVVLYFTLDCHLNGALGLSSDVEKHLELGKKLLKEGKLSESLFHYSKAVEVNPSNYLTYFKRAAVFLALGQSKKALPDLASVIRLKPDFHQARLQRGGILLKLGQADEAMEDFTFLTSSDNSATEEAQTLLQQASKMKEHRATAEHMVAKGECEEAIPFLTESIEVSPWNVQLREMRAQCFETVGNYQSAISDIKMTTKLVSDNSAAYLRASRLYYSMAEEENALREVRECLKLDPDHSECFPYYKKVKKLSKQLGNAQKAKDDGNHEEAVEFLMAALRTEGEEGNFVLRIRQQICHSYSQLKRYEDGLKWCALALELDPAPVDVLCDRAELYIGNQMYEEAIDDYQKASQHNNQNQRVQDGLNRAQKLLKQSKKRDYYKILGVKRTATTREINRAYRKLAAKWHPDKFEGQEEKSKAEKKFYDIASAKEVLSDKEKREKFDNGEDPLDPEQQSHGHQGPFGFPFGQGGFTFKFNF